MTTPMMSQYQRCKAEFPSEILFFRMGDFYEMFGDDAVKAAAILDIALTSRSKDANAMPMCGVPHHSAEGYIQRLLRAGQKVAICEQLSDPRESKGIVDRGVTRVVTPGTLTDDALLDQKAHNFLAAVWLDADKAGLAWLELSTGRFVVEECPPAACVEELQRIAPAECLVAEAAEAANDPASALRAAARDTAFVSRPGWSFDYDNAYQQLTQQFRTRNLKGFGAESLRPAIRAAGAILRYIQETQRTAVAHVERLEVHDPSERLILDAVTQQALELTRGMRHGTRRGTLLDILDQTVTSMGARLLHDWILSPLRRVDAIRRRHDTVAELTGDDDRRAALQNALRGIADLERIIGRIACQRANARDLAQLGASLRRLPDLRAALQPCASAALRELFAELDPVEDLAQRLQAAVVDAPPLTVREGGMIRDGYHAELDGLRAVMTDGKTWMANFQAREIERTGIHNLRVGFNDVFGFYIEITHAAGRNKIPGDYTRKQTLKNAERYITPELKEYENKVLHAEERAQDLEYRLFTELRDLAAQAMHRVLAAARIVAEADVFASLAQTARTRRYVRPAMDDSRVLQVTDGRHPVLEAVLQGDPFVPNDVDLDGQESRVMVITGPNMAGKSTYIRQVALLVVMAQLGSFVPAAGATIGVADRVFTRVGASDEISRGESTFMVEMSETANILNNATDRSLVILDEVGRGTSTFDGLSLAWAITEHLNNRTRCRALFATHYHELTDLAELHAGIRNYNIAVREWNEQIVFLRKIVAGGTDKSYGLHVARLAGIPPTVIARAREILKNLEEENADLVDKNRRAARGEAGAKTQYQLTLFHPQADPRLEEIRKLLHGANINEMTPLQALQLLEQLKRRAEE